jgi:transcriptional regulator with XRE-family HTH domain
MDAAQSQRRRAFGKAVRHFRAKRGISQERLALAAGIDRTHMTVLEQGRSSPTLDTLMKLCPALGISFVDLAGEIERNMKKRHPVKI